MLRGFARRVIDKVQVSNNAASIFGVLSLPKFVSISSEIWSSHRPCEYERDPMLLLCPTKRPQGDPCREQTQVDGEYGTPK